MSDEAVCRTAPATPGLLTNNNGKDLRHGFSTWPILMNWKAQDSLTMTSTFPGMQRYVLF